MVLPKVEQQIAAIQQEMVDNAALWANLRWRELGEKSAGYLQRTATQRQNQRLILSLQHPINNQVVTTTQDIQSAARSFYNTLYTPDPVDQDSINHLLNYIPSTCTLNHHDCDNLTTNFTIEDLIDGAKRTPSKSSPGLDGLPYEVWYLVLQHPEYQELACSIYNAALTDAIYPPSWSKTAVTLLPKKGDLTSLHNWRPISLINTNAKIFTRLLNARLCYINRN
ncbi:hypothetical protein INT45_002570 [Circinella minor]|uniref:Reverse transcriptase domain-containing protein n=1 Tax=Circinella minor TaxID=1195481 RepID=A0A8H7VFY8_9FUNG|nr:hypothetical protein INT45_002570 [Circinella minor]